MWNLKSGYVSDVSLYHSQLLQLSQKNKSDLLCLKTLNSTPRRRYKVMQKQGTLCSKASFISRTNLDAQLNYRIASCNNVTFCHSRAKIQSITISSGSGSGSDLDSLELRHKLQRGVRVEGVADETRWELSDDEDDLCPVECVREFKTDEEFLKILGKAKETNSLVVVDFYRTSCGSCKYIEKGFSKLCKGAGGEDAPVIFLKHNVIDEYDEQSEVAERLRIKAVPLFHFYKNGVLLEAFATRDKERIDEAILKYTSTNEDA